MQRSSTWPYKIIENMPNGNISVLKNTEIPGQSSYDALDGILGNSTQAYFAKHFHISCSKTAMAVC